ncbi:hypothetical protein ACK3TF_005786 [Chlorella vulgaris]
MSVQGARADSLSFLQNLGTPLSKATMTTASMPEFSPVPSTLDFSLDGWYTRVKKCCKEAPTIDRMSSEVYPIPAAAVRDLRGQVDVLGRPSRYDGRDPVVYRR